MLYHQASMRRLPEKARHRNYNADEFPHHLSAEQFEFRERDKRDVAAATKGKEKSPTTPNVPTVPKAPQVPKHPLARNQNQLPTQ